MPGYDEWLALIESLPGAAKAIAELVGEIGHLGTSVVHIGTAKAKQISGRIEAKAASDQKLIAAQGKSDVAAVVEESKGLIARAKAQREAVNVRQQENREAVTRIAIEHLVSDPPSEAPAEEPSSDWLNIFGAYAEKASSETMRQHWARILELEIKQPSSFSLQGLLLASLLDGHLAACINRISPYLLNRRALPKMPPFTNGQGFNDVLDLASIGFLEMGEHQISVSLPTEKENALRINNMIFKVDRNPTNAIIKREQSLAIPVYFLSMGGRDLAKVIEVNQGVDMVERILQLLKEIGHEASFVGYASDV